MPDSMDSIIRRLDQHGRALATVIVVLSCIGLAYLAGLYVTGALDHAHGLRLRSTADGIHLGSASDGPFVVTHLYQPWSENPTSSVVKCVATLPEPITIIDSGGHYITRDELRALTWIDAYGNTNAAPLHDAQLCAFYWVPQETE